MSPELLRAKLLAQRAQQQREAERKVAMHNEAKAATKTLILLGYNYDDILDLASPTVSDEHLTTIFRSIGYFRKRKRVSERNTAFGAARWLDRPNDLVIDLESDSSSTSDSSEYCEASEPVDSDENTAMNVAENDHQHFSPDNSQHHEPGDEIVEVIVDSENSPKSSFNEPLLIDSTTPTPPQAEMGAQHSSESSDEEMPDVATADDVMFTDVEEDIAEEQGQVHSDRLDHQVGSQTPEFTTPAENNHETNVADGENVDFAKNVTQTNSDSSQSQQSIRQELARVQAQIRKMQQRKLGSEANKRALRLRDVITRRSTLLETKQSINIRKLTLTVSRLEARLTAARMAMLQAAQRLKDIDKESKQLEKEESQIRKDIAAEKAEAVQETQAGQEPNVKKYGSLEQIAENSRDHVNLEQPEAEKPAKTQLYPLLTAQESPLRMFSSFRMCPSLKPSHWFSPTFNSRFVSSLLTRTWCHIELSKGTCTRQNCKDVHFTEFQVTGLQVCKYMATREIDQPERRAGLVNALRLHLKKEEVPIENVAATIIGFRKKRDNTVFLDWGDIPLPF